MNKISPRRKKSKPKKPAEKKDSPSRWENFRKKFSQWFSNFSIRMSAYEKELFIKRLSFLMKAGIPILQSMAMIKEQTKSNRQKKIIDVLSQDISSGHAINVSMQRFKNIFGPFIINVIRVGENTGFLYQNLNYLADELKKRRLLSRKVIGALIYPIFITIATVGITTLLIVFIFPKILPIFKSLNITLPITTRIILGLSSFLANNYLYVLGGLALLGLLSFFLSKIKRVQILIGNITPSIPVFGLIMKNYHLVNICRTLGLLLKSDVGLIEALRITAETSPNIIYKTLLGKIGDNVLKGKKISVQFEDYKRFFPILIPQMISVGETTGNLSGSLLYLAEFYESEVDEAAKNLSSVIEPVLMIFMGLIVGFVAISIITPIYGITQHLNVR
jgi:type IV pilus assembly protein PilC